MSYSLAGFDANKVEPAAAYEVLKPDWYRAIIVESEDKKTKAGDGSYLNLKIRIIEGSNEGQYIFDMLHLGNKNQQAVEIAQRSLSAICRAVGVFTPRESSQLHNIPLMVKVGIDPAKGEYEAKNIVKGYGPTKPVGKNDNAPETNSPIWGGVNAGPDETNPPSATSEPDSAPWR